MLYKLASRVLFDDMPVDKTPLRVLRCKGLLKPGTLTLLITPPGHVRAHVLHRSSAVGRVTILAIRTHFQNGTPSDSHPSE